MGTGEVMECDLRLTRKEAESVMKPSVRKGFGLNENSTVMLLLDQLRRESQKQQEDGDLKDGEYQKISELIGQIERTFANV